MQAICLLSLLVELRIRTITTPERDAPTSSQPHIVDEVLALVNSVPKTAEAILDVQSAVDPIKVRTPALFHHHPSSPLY